MRLAYFFILFGILKTLPAVYGQEPLPPIIPTATKPLKSDTDPNQYCIQDITIDQQGRMWFSTCGVAQEFYSMRVVQFDGYNIRPLSIAREGWEGYARSTLEGESLRKGFYGFLNRYPQQSALFIHDVEKNKVSYTPINGVAGGIIEYAPGQFWVLVKEQNTFVLYKWAGQQLERYAEIPSPGMFEEGRDRYLVGGEIPFIKKGSVLWFCDHSLPIYAFDTGSKELKVYGLKDFPAFLPDTPDEKLRINAQVDLVAHQGGLYTFHSKRNTQFQVLRKNEEQFTSLALVPEGYKASGIYKDSLEQLLLVYTQQKGEKKQGAILIDKDGKRWDYSAMIQQLPTVKAIRSHNFFNAAYVATQKGAYLITAGKRTAIMSLMEHGGFRSTRQNARGRLFVKYGTGIGQILQNKIQEIRPGYCFEDYLKKTGEFHLLTDPDSNIWLKTRQDIIRYLPKSDQSCHIHHFDFEIGMAVFLSSSTLLVVDKRASRIHFYDLKTQKLRPLLIDGKAFSFSGLIHNLLLDDKDILWVASNEGLYQVDLTQKKVSHFGAGQDFEDHRVLVIEKDRHGRIWLGTVYGGVHLFDPERGEVVKIINNANGLSNNTVVSILEDDEGDIWVGTYDGLNLLDAEGNVISSFNTEDGLSHYEFNRYSYYKDREGLLYMGTVSGLNIIDPSLLKQELKGSGLPKIYLTQLSYYDSKTDKKVNVHHLQSFDETIVLEADNRNITVDVAMTNYGFASKNRYAYRLEGINREWNYMGNNHQIKLFNLPAGSYQLSITGIDKNGNWAENPIALNIHAREYFYKQSWFYMALALPFLVFALLWVRRLRQEKDILEREVDKRTVQIRKDKELIEQQASELRQLDQMKSRFFANISHDFRTPLTLITGPAELLKGEDEFKRKPRIRESLQSILLNGKKLLNLVDEMMDLARIESRQVRLREAQIELYPYCEKIFQAYRADSVRKNIRYELNYQIGASSQLVTDPGRLEKILSNLLSNAFKFTPEQGAITFRVYADQDRVYFEVKDNGRGIPAEDLPHIFDRYFQSNQHALSAASGSGIGLSLSSELARLLKGEIQVQSQYGEGATFVLSLPGQLVKGSNRHSKESTPVVKPATGVQPPVMKKRDKQASVVMIIEDNLEVQEFVAGLLSEKYEVICRNNGQEALHYLEAQGHNSSLPLVDLILSDINMPLMNGYELLDAVKQNESLQQIPVIMLTARMQEKSKLKALRMGVDDYLTKPFSPAELLLRIENLLSNYKKRKSYQQEHAVVAPQFEEAPSASQLWLTALEETSLEALEKQVDLTIAYLASAMAISERQLSRKVKLITGLTIGKYIQEIKLQKARYLLENKIISSVSEASYLSGFKSPSYFTKVYHQYYGKKPSVYLSGV
jgi:signal transduction histidine kinase/DNA-binding response OmpR family regulator